MQLIWAIFYDTCQDSWWQQLLGKTYGLRYKNGAMVSDSVAYRKTKSCRQHGLSMFWG